MRDRSCGLVRQDALLGCRLEFLLGAGWHRHRGGPGLDLGLGLVVGRRRIHEESVVCLEWV